jgi:hypothetical protein
MNKNEIIKIVQDLSKKKGSSILKREFPFPVSYYLKYFKTWSEVLEAAGLTKNVLKNLSKEDLINYILKYKREFGKSPRYEDFINLKGYPSASKIIIVFGTWTNALKEAGISKKSKKFEIENNLVDELLETFSKEYIKLNYPSKKNYNINRNKLAPSSSYLETITNKRWNQILEDLNFKVLSKPVKTLNSKKEIIEEYKRYSKKIGAINGATFKELEKSNININTIRLRFGGINGLRLISGYSYKNIHNKFSKEEIIEILKEKYLEKNRRLTAQEISNDKNIPGITTICSYFFTTKISEVWEEVEKNIN